MARSKKERNERAALAIAGWPMKVKSGSKALNQRQPQR